MKYFELLAVGVDVLPLQHALHRHPNLWNENSLRSDFENSPHREAEDILLRFQAIPAGIEAAEAKQAVMQSLDCDWWPAWHQLPQARALVFDLLRRVEASRLGRVMLTRLASGGRIYPHPDQGIYSGAYDRYHIVVQAQPGCQFRAEDDTVQMRTGEVWWLQNRVEHEVANNSGDERIHLIVDLQQ